MNPVAVLIALVVFLALTFLPYFIAKKGSTYRTHILWGCVALAALLVPSMLYQWDQFQTVMVVAWVVLIGVAIFARNSTVA
jgi:hypothetical protein